MPLVVAALIILVLIFNFKDSSERSARKQAVNANYRRKTNAIMEQKLVTRYMQHGMSFDEAFRKSYQDMIDAGYEPCIPREAYGDNSREQYQSSKTDKPPYEYDSFWVKQRREAVESEWSRLHPKTRAPRDLIEKQIYEDFPTTDYEYELDLKRQGLMIQAIPVGEFLIYPGLGTCEVLSYDLNFNKTNGTYVLKVLKTGEVVSYVRIGDKSITRQGGRL